MKFEEKLENSDLTRSMWILWILSAGLIALDGFDFFIIGVALPFIEKDFELTPPEIGAVAVAAIIGSLVGSLTLGAITDKIGRQKMLLVDVIIFLISSMGTALAWSAFSLIFFRFLVGVAIGADYPISVAYITENVPSRFRGRMIIGAFTFQAVGAALGAITGIVVIKSCVLFSANPLETAIKYGWRIMLGFGLIMAIVIYFLRLQFLLESPRYFITKGDYTAASIAASELLEMEIEITPEDEPLQEDNITWSALFSRYWRQTVFASVPWFLQDISTYGIGIFTPTIISVLAFSKETDFLSVQINSASGAALVDLFLILGFLVAVLLVDKVGRVKLQIAGFLGMALGLTILTLKEGNNTSLTTVLVGFFVFNFSMNAGPNSTTFLLSGEVFPTAIRATGAGVAAAFAKLGAVLGTYLLPILRVEIGVNRVLYILAISCVLAAVVTYVFRIETTGKSLEQLDSV